METLAEYNKGDRMSVAACSSAGNMSSEHEDLKNWKDLIAQSTLLRFMI